jgi:hypothetical protein
MHLGCGGMHVGIDMYVSATLWILFQLLTSGRCSPPAMPREVRD